MPRPRPLVQHREDRRQPLPGLLRDHARLDRRLPVPPANNLAASKKTMNDTTPTPDDRSHPLAAIIHLDDATSICEMLVFLRTE